MLSLKKSLFCPKVSIVPKSLNFARKSELCLKVSILSKGLNCAWKSKVCPKVSYHTDTPFASQKQNSWLAAMMKVILEIELLSKQKMNVKMDSVFQKFFLTEFWNELICYQRWIVDFFFKIPFQWILNFEFVPHRSIVNLQMPGEHASCGPKLENSG